MISPRPSAGTGMLAVLCDLAPEWHREFREWLRDDMMPARMRIGFPAAASYDRIEGAADNTGGSEPFATVYEAASIGDLYGAPYQGLRTTRDQRDKDFHARFLKPARYTLSWVGPELIAPSPTLTHDKGARSFAPIAVIDRLEIAAPAVQALNMWYVIDYLPRLAAVTGIVRVRRYLAMEGTPRHVLVHELDGAGALSGPDWRAARASLAGQQVEGRISGAYTRVLSATP